MLTRYWGEEPWGAWRDNFHAGLIASTVANFGSRKTKRPLKPTDFMLRAPEQAQRRNRGKLLTLFKATARKRKQA